MARHNRSKKQLIQIITQYGIHIWAILIIANAVMVYTYQFASHAASPKFLDASQMPTPSTDISPTDNSSDQGQPQPTATGGPLLDLTFTVPGIGSGGGVMKPIHLKRNVTVFLYRTDVNSANPTVKPLYTIQGFATFDDDPESPTYTSFINPVFDLGSDVQDGNYQIAFRTDQSLRTIIKQNPTDIGGEIISLSKNSDPIQLPSQTVLMGDILPDQGDNMVNVSDYNAFINCYGAKNTSNFCQGKNYGDFNDDGVVDGIDYNILIRSLNTLVQEGLPIPQISPTPSSHRRISRLITQVTPTKTAKNKKITPTPTKAPQTQKNSGSPLGILLFFIIIVVLGSGGFLLYRKNPELFETIKALIHLSPTGTPDTIEKKSDEANQSAKPEEIVQVEPSPKDESITEEKQIEKDCYVKTKGPDATGNGMWLLLTDDNGPIQAHYSKNDAKDGFAKIKGIMKTENGKQYLEVSEISAEE